MKILITGGNGFIAKSLFEVFKNEFKVVLKSRQELDLLDAKKLGEFLKKANFDVVIHSATYDAAPVFSKKDPAKVLEMNLKMFFNLSRCKDYYAKMIFFGSGAEFGRENWVPKIKEDSFDQNIPTDQYGFSKYIMTQFALLSDNIYNLRLFGLFGKYDDWRYRLIPNLCCRAVFDMPLTINNNKKYDFMYIDDLIKIVRWVILNKPKRKVYNVCSGTVFDFRSIAKIIKKVSGKDLEIRVKEENLEIEYSGDNYFLTQELENFNFTSMENGIKDLYSWYTQNRNLIDKDQLL